MIVILQCSDTVGWVTGRVSSLSITMKASLL